MSTTELMVKPVMCAVFALLIGTVQPAQALEDISASAAVEAGSRPLAFLEGIAGLLNELVWRHEQQEWEAERQEMRRQGEEARLLQNAFGLPANAAPVRIRDVRPDTNPFYDEFGAYDLWIVENRLDVADAAELDSLRQPAGEPPAPDMLWHSGFLWVDLHGTVLPTYRYYLDAAPRPQPQSLEEAVRGAPSTWPPYRLHAAGWIDRRTYEDRWRQQYRARAAHAGPQIPAWLGENPPITAWFIPNGEILTLGELGSGREHGLRFVGAEAWQALATQQAGAEFEDQTHEPQPLLRFTASGELIQRIEPGELAQDENRSTLAWVNVYFPGQRELYSQVYERGNRLRMAGSYFVEVDSKRFYGPLLAIYDYDGTPLPLAPLPPPRHGYCKRLPTFAIELLYQAQHGH